MDFNNSLISSEALLPIMLKPRVFLVTEKKNNNLFLNIALRYRLDYIDIGAKELRSVKPAVNLCYQRDIVLYNYSPSENLISDDVNWI
jgi:hypothetical protein